MYFNPISHIHQWVLLKGNLVIKENVGSTPTWYYVCKSGVTHRPPGESAREERGEWTAG